MLSNSYFFIIVVINIMFTIIRRPSTTTTISMVTGYCYNWSSRAIKISNIGSFCSITTIRMTPLLSCHTMIIPDNNKSSSMTLPHNNNNCHNVIMVQQQRRWKNKNAKMGQHIQTLNELAHDQERKSADERKNKKNKKKDEVTTSKSTTTNNNNNKNKKNNNKVDNKVHTNIVDHDEDDDDDDDDDVTSSTDDETISLPEPKHVKEKMQKIIIQFDEYLKTIRGSEPTPEMFDHIMVNAYNDDERTSLKSVCQITLDQSTLAKATCYDPSLIKNVMDAIRNDPILSLNPYIGGEEYDNNIIYIPIPRMSIDVRNELTNIIKKRGEIYKQRIRKIRRNSLDIVKQGMSGKLEHISKDDAHTIHKEIELISDTMINNITKAIDTKQRTILQV